MSTQQPFGRPPLHKRGPKRTETTYFVVGVVFLVVGIGLYFGDSAARLPFFMVGITFLILCRRLAGQEGQAVPR